MRVSRRILFAAVTSLFLLSTGATALAATASDPGVVQSYGTDQQVRQGMIVALSAKDQSKVEPLTINNVTDMFGVAVSPTEAPITVTGDTGTQVYVATSGQYNVLVSTQNGNIHAGDYISISALNGIGMKAADSEATILGRAAADLTNTSVIQRDVPVVTATGTQKVMIGMVPVSIMIASNPNAGHGTGNLPGFLAIASQAIASKPVPAERVYFAAAAFLASAFISATVIYSGIRGGILSIGRNPLAKRSILGGLYQAVFSGVSIFILGLFAVYLLLRI